MSQQKRKEEAKKALDPSANLRVKRMLVERGLHENLAQHKKASAAYQDHVANHLRLTVSWLAGDQP